MGSMNDKLREILEILRCDIINSVEDTTISITEEEIRQREFINQAQSQIKALFQATKLTTDKKLREVLIECGLDAPEEDEIQKAIGLIKALFKKESEG